MKMSKKVVFVFILVVVITLFISTISFGAYSPNSFKSKISATGDGADEIKTLGGKIVGIIQVVGTIVSVAMVMVLGIKYMVGSSEEKATYKKSLLPYLIGAVLLFAATNLTQIIYDWATNSLK